MRVENAAEARSPVQHRERLGQHAAELVRDERVAPLQGLAEVLEKTRDYAGAQTVLSRLIASSSNFVYWLEWGRIGLIRYWWVWLLTALALFFKGRFYKARSASNG